MDFHANIHQLLQKLTGMTQRQMRSYPLTAELGSNFWT